jgi:hypothetical protein
MWLVSAGTTKTAERLSQIRLKNITGTVIYE